MTTSQKVTLHITKTIIGSYFQHTANRTFLAIIEINDSPIICRITENIPILIIYIFIII